MDLLILGKEAIQPDQPAGQEARYTPEFEQLQVEIDKLSLPSASGGVDWRKVENLASVILAQKSKDLAVASYLTVALIYNRQVEGLALGLQIYRDLLENFWETLYPSKARMRGRVRTMEWWVEKMETALATLPAPSFSPELFQKVKANFDQIEDFVSQNIEEPPALSALRDFFKTIEETAIAQPAAEEKKAEEEKPSPRPAAAPSGPAREEPEVISSMQEVQRALNSIWSKMREIAAFLFQENIANPQAYRLNRIAMWSIVENLPPAAEGKTKIPPPPGQVRNILVDLKAKGNYEALARAAEERVSQFIFWLDLNRLVVEALTILGSPYQAAAEAVKKETAYLIFRLSGLEELAFADGTPFADSETKGWLKEIASTTAVTLSAPLSSSASPSLEEDLMGKEVAKAKEMIKEGKLLEAISDLQQKMHQSSSGKEKILWRLAIAQLLLEMKKPRPARPYLEQILKDIDNYSLEEWDPYLALRGLKTIWLGWNNAPDPGLKEKLNDILLRIAKLDLTEAMRLGLS